MKVSYRTTPNLGAIISSHNKQILQEFDNEQAGKECNCRAGYICPLDGKCLKKNIIYQATIIPKKEGEKEENYIGLTSTTFKARLANHKASLKNRNLESSCKLAQHAWKLKDKYVDFDLKWKIICTAKPFSPIKIFCKNLIMNRLEKNVTAEQVIYVHWMENILRKI